MFSSCQFVAELQHSSLQFQLPAELLAKPPVT
jgi:hypothetical protein